MSEKSFLDRQGKAESLRDTVGGFTLAFAPADTTLSTVNFTLYLNGVAALNTQIGTQVGTYSTSARGRSEHVKLLQKRVTQALGRLRSNSAWSLDLFTAKGIVDKLRGTKPKAPKPPTENPTPEEEKKRESGEQAYVEVASHLEKFIATVTAATGYNTSAPTDITISALTTLLTQLRTMNTTLSTLDGALSTNREKRRQLYYGAKGLAEKFQAIKEAVKSQYNQTSPEYVTVKGIKW